MPSRRCGTPWTSSLRQADTRPLADVLRTVVRELVRVVDCGCGAISVGTPDGRLECFVTAGDATAADILFGPPSSADDPLNDVAAEAVNVHVPAGADGATARMGVPILLRGRAAGGCYLGDPRLGPAFADGNLALLQLAAQGVATIIEKARTSAANRQREAWYENGVQVAREIVAGAPEPLRLVVERAAAVSGSSVGCVVQRGPDNELLLVTAATGTAADEWLGTEVRAPDPVAASVLATGRPSIVTNLRETSVPEMWVNRLGIDTALVLPLMGSGNNRGVLVLGRAPGADRFTPAEMSMAAMFAGTVALALELSQSQILRNQVALVAERDRIARDLHDHVIQRLYAIGLAMQSVIATTPEPEAERLLRSLDEIDDTIKQIRATIFRLTTPILSAAESLRAQADELVDELTPALGFRPALEFTGPVDFSVDPDVVADCAAVLREAITNIARHAEATDAAIEVSVTSDDIRLRVADNGRGLGSATRRSGIANLRARAEDRGGFMQVRTAPGEGTSLLWCIPLRVAG